MPLIYVSLIRHVDATTPIFYFDFKICLFTLRVLFIMFACLSHVDFSFRCLFCLRFEPLFEPRQLFVKMACLICHFAIYVDCRFSCLPLRRCYFVYRLRLHCYCHCLSLRRCRWLPMPFVLRCLLFTFAALRFGCLATLLRLFCRRYLLLFAASPDVTALFVVTPDDFFTHYAVYAMLRIVRRYCYHAYVASQIV